MPWLCNVNHSSFPIIKFQIKSQHHCITRHARQTIFFKKNTLATKIQPTKRLPAPAAAPFKEIWKKTLYFLSWLLKNDPQNLGLFLLCIASLPDHLVNSWRQETNIFFLATIFFPCPAWSQANGRDKDGASKGWSRTLRHHPKQEMKMK